MNKFVLSMVAALALCVAATAQGGGPASPQGTQRSSPSMQGPGTQNQQPGVDQTGNGYPQAGQSGQNGNMGNDSSKGEKKLKGCVSSQGSQATLETKKGKEVALSGQDVSAHNGHEVELKGMWESGSMSQSSAGAGSSGEKTFNVTEVKMISETCKGSKEKGSSSMGNGSAGSTPTSPSSTGNSTGGSTTQPQ